MARLHEYQGKAILAANGFKIPRGRAASMADEAVAVVKETSSHCHELADHCFASFGAGEAASFWKRGSSRSSAGVSGTFSPSGPEPGIESNFCNAAMARSGSP